MDPSEQRAVCPYDPVNHNPVRKHLQAHLIKCAKNHASLGYMYCYFNTTHRVPKSEWKNHVENLCPDKKNFDSFMYTDENVGAPLHPIQHIEYPQEENWDDCNYTTYDPTTRLQETPVISYLAGATPSERKKYRLEERKRFQEMNANVHAKNASNNAGAPGPSK